MKILQVGEGREFSILDLPIPQAGPGEVVLKVEAVATCPQWDLHLRHNEPMFNGHSFHYPYTPGQPGHEATGTVAALGSGVGELEVGQRVSTWRDSGHQLPGCYAHYVVRRAADIIGVPDDLSPEATVSVELAMCVAASFLMQREMRAVAGRTYAVVGLGPAGLIAAQMARAEGAAKVVGFDPSPMRRDLGLSLGLDQTLDPKEHLESCRFDTAIDCVGAKSSVEWIMDRTSDVVALFGVQREDYTFAPRHYSLRLCGYPGHSRAAAEYAVNLIIRGKLNMCPLLTHHFPLERYDQAIDLLERQEAIKVCFWPWQNPPPRSTA